MEPFSFGKRVTRIKRTAPPGGRKDRIPVKAPTQLGSQILTVPVASGNPTNACALPETLPLEVGEVDTTTVTQYEKRQILEKAAQKQAELPELIIMENTISLFSYKKLKRIATAKIDNVNDSGPGSVNDPKMGVIEGNQICGTCHLDNFQCPGHLGYIDFETMIYHPFFLREVVQILNCVCRSCGRLLLDENEIKKKGLNNYSLKTRLNLIEKESLGVSCIRPREVLPGGKVIPCKPNYIYLPQKIKDNHQVHYKKDSKDEGVHILDISRVRKILKSIPDEDAVLLGFNPKFGSHPKNIVLKAVPVIPPITRYPVPIDGILEPHKITEQYKKIIRYNNALKKVGQDKLEREKFENDIFTAIQHLFENTDKAANYPGSKVFHSLKDLIQGKEAVIRGLLMGKRGNYTARTVLSPDPSLKFGQIGVPRIFAPYLTRRERVFSHNKKALEELLEEREVAVDSAQGRAWIGGPSRKGLVKKERKITHIIYGPNRKLKGQRKELLAGKKYNLMIGDIVERHLRNGDLIVSGRQPTLHKLSLMAFEVVLRDELTIGLHLSYTTPMNADRR